MSRDALDHCGVFGSIARLGRNPYVVVQEFWREVGAVGPDKSLKVRMDLESTKDDGIAKRLEYPAVNFRSEVDFARRAIAEPKPENEFTAVTASTTS